MNAQPNAAAAGTIDVGGDLTVNRLGFGAMRLTGREVWGEPEDPAAARAVLRRAIELGINLIDTAWYYGPHVANRNRHLAIDHGVPSAGMSTRTVGSGHGRHRPGRSDRHRFSS